jgi:hypothetical protein
VIISLEIGSFQPRQDFKRSASIGTGRTGIHTRLRRVAPQQARSLALFVESHRRQGEYQFILNPLPQIELTATHHHIDVGLGIVALHRFLLGSHRQVIARRVEHHFDGLQTPTARQLQARGNPQGQQTVRFCTCTGTGTSVKRPSDVALGLNEQISQPGQVGHRERPLGLSPGPAKLEDIDFRGVFHRLIIAR